MPSAPEQKAVTVVIAGRPYPLRVNVAELDQVEAMVADINARFDDFKAKFGGRDTVDCLVMTLLTYGDELRRARAAAGDVQNAAVSARIEALSSLVDGLM